MRKKNARLTQGPVGRCLFYLTLPMSIGIFAMVAFNFADTYFVSKLGTKHLAAMGFTFPVVLLIHSIALGLGMGAAAVISRAIGKGNFLLVRRLTTDSLFLGIVIVVGLVGAGLLTINPLFRLLGATDETLPLIRKYMSVWYIGMIFVVVPMVGNNAIRATGDTKIPGLIMLIAAGLNFAMDPILIFGLYGFPRLGIAGAALATVIGRATTMIISLSVLHFRERMLDLSLPSLREILDSWKKILYIAIPTAATNLLNPLSMGVITRLVAGFGKEAVAGVGAGLRVEAFAIMPIRALSATLIPFTGQNFGAGKWDRVKSAQFVSVLFSLGWGLLCFLLFLPTAPKIAGIFSRDPKVVTVTIHFLRIVSLGYGMQGICLLAAAAFNALNRPIHASILNIVRMFVLYIPLAWIGASFFHVDGVFSGIVLANLAAGILSMYWLRRMLREKTERLSGQR